MDLNIRLTIDAPKGWKRRALLYVGLPIALVGATAAVAKAYDTTWIAAGQPLSAVKLKADLDEAQARLATLESALSATSESEIQVYDTFGPGAAAFGSTNTAIFRFKMMLVQSGTGITYASSPTAGDSFTINEPGLYAIQVMSVSPTAPAGGGATQLGISVNALPSETTTQVYSIDVTHRLNAAQTGIPGGGRTYPTVGGVYRLKAGDVVRAHGKPGDFCEASPPQPFFSFRIVKVAPLL